MVGVDARSRLVVWADATVEVCCWSPLWSGISCRLLPTTFYSLDDYMLLVCQETMPTIEQP